MTHEACISIAIIYTCIYIYELLFDEVTNTCYLFYIGWFCDNGIVSYVNTLNITYQYIYFYLYVIKLQINQDIYI